MTAGAPLFTAYRARWLLAALHPMMIGAPVWYTAFGTPLAPPLGSPVPVLGAGVALVLLQLWHSLAAVRLDRPYGWPATYAGVLALAYVPHPWWAPSWVEASWFAMASSLMLLRGRVRIAVFGALAGFAASWHLVVFAPDTALAVGRSVVAGLILPVPALILFGATRLVYALDELEANRAELAELAVRRERLRLSRNLHDLLGQSLTAVSLKGDLALRLLPTDPRAARAEVADLSRLARDTLQGMRAVTYDTHAVSLRGESDSAVTLLRAAGVVPSIDEQVTDLPPVVDAMLGWALREGVANVLRHSDAETCRIIVRTRGHRVRLEIVNDGVAPPTAGQAGQGSGLDGLTARAEALGGFVAAGLAGDDGFRLVVEIPAAPPMTNVISER
ncbi:MAG: histidine kinase [Micromonosporaceae bacterium]